MNSWANGSQVKLLTVQMGDEQDSYQFEVTVHDVLSLQQLKTLEDGVCALPHI